MLPDGTLWTNAPGSGTAKWKRYLGVFEEVILAVRTCQAEQVPEGWIQMDSPGITVWKLPYFEGPWQFLLKRTAVRRSVGNLLQIREAVILRAPHHVSDVVLQNLQVARPFGVEVVGDPNTALAPGSLRSVLRGPGRRYFVSSLRRTCSRACAVAYVTETVLQERYPSSAGAFTTHYSSAEISEEMLLQKPRQASGPPFVLFHAGSMTTFYKGQDLAIRAVKLLSESGWDLELRLAGEGPIRLEFEGLAARLGISKKVSFLGGLPGLQAIQNQLDESDLFVYPSRSEGLPRILIEAMARGIPCVASRVGGIGELLPSADTVRDVTPQSLAVKIKEVLSDRGRLESMSAHNLMTASRYTAPILEKRRREFQLRVKDSTRDWLDVVGRD